MELSYPKVKRKANGEYFIEFTLKSKRIRLLNGQKIKSQLKPNDYPPNERKSKAELLAKQVCDYFECNNYSFNNEVPKNELEHSSINVSLTYLRGLEIPELNEEDMPMIK